MKTIDNLFIRACKSKDPRKRLYSVYCRVFTRYYSEEVSKKFIVNLLSVVISENGIGFDLNKFIKESSPDYLFSNEPYDYWDSCLASLINILRLTPASELIEKGYRIPRMFRK